MKGISFYSEVRATGFPGRVRVEKEDESSGRHQVLGPVKRMDGVPVNALGEEGDLFYLFLCRSLIKVRVPR